MVVDIHTHCFADSLAKRAINSLSERGDLIPFCDGTISGLKNSMHNSGVNISVLQTIATKPEQTPTINRWAVDVQDSDIMSFGTIHPAYPKWKDEIKFLIDSGVKGIKMHPDYQNFFVDEPTVFPIYEKIFNEGLIILFHAGIDVGLPDPCHCPPSRLRKVIDTFPGAKVIAAHMGGYKFWDDVKKYLFGTEVYLDTSFSFDALGLTLMKPMILEHGANKILFGTDSPWTDQNTEIQNIQSLGLSNKETDMILGNNAMKLLKPH